MNIEKTCVTPEGKFQYGIHKPQYNVTNLRQETHIALLGQTIEEQPVKNERNYPRENITVAEADWVYEIPNPFYFKGRTFIDKEWADASANNPGKISIQQPEKTSLTESLIQAGAAADLFDKLPPALLLALATTSTDPNDLTKLATLSCDFIMNGGLPDGLIYDKNERDHLAPVIHDHPLFEAVANNPYLPDQFKIAMVIRPGAQGASEIVGEWPKDKHSHVYEYLRRNSYIPGGHYAANMADDAVRYSIDSLSELDMKGLRHLYYQRTYRRLAEELHIETEKHVGLIDEEKLEQLRLAIVEKLKDTNTSPATLWGWNFGFDFAPSLYRLHASHQQVHQQYAIVPELVERYNQGTMQPTGLMASYCCGDLIADCVKRYHQDHGRDFFVDYLRAIETNERMDERKDLESSLVIWRDDRAMLFVPKAQTSQWELQLITLPAADSTFAGNVVECDAETRSSLDKGILTAQKALSAIGAKMVTSIEYSKRINQDVRPLHPLLYAFLPRLPESPGAFSEAQLRYINGHYPEDFAALCRRSLNEEAIRE